MDLPILDVLYKWHHTVSGLSWLFLCVTFPSVIMLWYGPCSFLWVSNIPPRGQTMSYLAIHRLMNRWVASAIMNSALQNPFRLIFSLTLASQVDSLSP